MKYKDFHAYLTTRVGANAIVGPSISIKVGINPKISMTEPWFEGTSRFIVFPIKLYGENIRHLNILLLDQKTKIVERFEPFNLFLNFHQINDLLEPFLYKLMGQRKIYFLKYQTTLNPAPVVNDQNCGLYCVKYVVQKIF
jgi:hypothetical protein